MLPLASDIGFPLLVVTPALFISASFRWGSDG